MYASTLDTPIGKLVIKANEQEVFFVGFPEQIIEEKSNEVSGKALEQFRAYFGGKLQLFDFPMKQPGTDFQQSVWRELTTIPAGKPISYAYLSKKMNNPLAIRAIASANGKNNLMIVVPCHRVIGSNGDLVGFGGGLWRKRWLLEHEAKMTGMGQASLIF
jgi:methylated-DNA-[protein]-cysteine S-methyltransferase